jgi:hypothetical protein
VAVSDWPWFSFPRSAQIRWGACLCFAALIGFLPIDQSRAQQFDYAAVLAGPARITGPVNAAGIPWQCNAKYCATRGPWPVPGIKACNALAAQVGPLASYGYKGRQLSAADLATCNGGKAPQATATQTTPINPLGALFQNLGANAKPGTPAAAGLPPPGPLPGFSQQQAAATTGISIRTPTLTVTGTGALATSLAFTPVTIRTISLQVTGMAFSPIAIRTPILTVTGTGSP